MTYRWNINDLLVLQDVLIASGLYNPKLKNNDQIHSLIQDVRSLVAVMNITKQKHVYPVPQGNMTYITGKDPNKL